MTYNLATVDSRQCPSNKPRHFRCCCPIEPFSLPPSRKARMILYFRFNRNWYVGFFPTTAAVAGPYHPDSPVSPACLSALHNYKVHYGINVDDVKPFPSQSSSSTSPSQSLSTSSPGVIAFAWQPYKRRGYRCIYEKDIISVKLYEMKSNEVSVKVDLDLTKILFDFYCVRGLILTLLAKIILYRSTCFFYGDICHEVF